MEETTQETPYNFSTGYLEDALMEFNFRFNRQGTQDPVLIGNLSPESSSTAIRSEIKEARRWRRRRRRAGVAYPFATVKPGGVDGDLTLEEINRRIKMAPSRAVRHPVGDNACRPFVVSSGGTGLSGKAVVALTRIHTQGRGTITIIRTKG